AQYRAYCEAAKVTPGDGDSLRGPANTPVVWVSWREAVRFCHWLGERARTKGWLPAGWVVALPSGAEWEKSARGGLHLPAATEPLGWEQLAKSVPAASVPNQAPARAYPWAGGADPNRASYDDTGIARPSAVGCFPGGKSPVGCEELSGNA